MGAAYCPSCVLSSVNFHHEHTNKAIGLIKKTGKLLVAEGYDRTKKEAFYRPLSGKIEFGETGDIALKREFREEIDAELQVIEFLKLFENIFTFENVIGHEIVLLYSAEFVDQSLYSHVDFVVKEASATFLAKWINIADFVNGKRILVPAGLTEYLAQHHASCD